MRDIDGWALEMAAAVFRRRDEYLVFEARPLDPDRVRRVTLTRYVCLEGSLIEELQRAIAAQIAAAYLMGKQASKEEE